MASTPLGLTRREACALCFYNPLKPLPMIKLITIAFLILSLKSFGQCNCQSFNKEGKSVSICDVKPIALDNSLQVGISYGKVETKPIVTLSIRYRYSIKNIKSDITLSLNNGNMIVLPLQKSGSAYIGNNEVCQAIFTLGAAQKNKLLASPIKTISFYLDDGLFHTLEVTLNNDILQNQLKCL